jgi:hypothetical protein
MSGTSISSASVVSQLETILPDGVAADDGRKRNNGPFDYFATKLALIIVSGNLRLNQFRLIQITISQTANVEIIKRNYQNRNSIKKGPIFETSSKEYLSHEDFLIKNI